jgi:hypothetical protein
MKFVFTGFVLAVATYPLIASAAATPASPSAAIPAVGLISAYNSRGVLSYCGEKGYLAPAQTELALSLTNWPALSEVKPHVSDLVRQAEEVGKRGVLFTFTTAQGDITTPSVTLESLAAVTRVTPVKLCGSLMAGGATAGKLSE